MRGHVFSFAFFPLTEPGEALLPDERIMPNIVKAIREKFADEQNLVLFIVDDSDERQGIRWRRFESIYQAARHTQIELPSEAVTQGDKSVMSALLIHSANPFIEEVTAQFFVLLAKLNKD